MVGQRGSVVDLFIGRTGKDYLSWGDGKGSVRYYEFHVCKVRVRICKLPCCQAHRVCSFCCICFLHFCSSTEAEICLFVQTTVTGNDCLIAFRFLRSSVILLRICMSGDGYGYLFLGCCDAQFAFFPGDVVVIRIKLLTCCIGNGIGYFTFAYIGNTSGCTDIGYLSCYKSVSSCYIRSGQGCSVIRFACTFAGKGYLSWGDLKFSVSYYKNDTRKVLVLVGELCFFQTHRIGVRICSLCFCLSTEFKVIFCIQIRIIFTDFYAFHLISAYTVFGSIIRFSICISLNGYNDCLFTFFNSQFSDFNLDIIVGSFGILIQLVSKSIIAASLIGLGSGYIVDCTFTLREIISRYNNYIICQRCAIVYFAVSCTCERQNTFCNIEITVCYYEFYTGKVFTDVFEFLCCQAHHVLISIGSHCSCTSTKVVIVFCVQCVVDGYVITFYCFFGSIIFEGIIMTCDGYGYFVNNWSDPEGSRFILNIVVFRFIASFLSKGNFISYILITYI